MVLNKFNLLKKQTLLILLFFAFLIGLVFFSFVLNSDSVLAQKPEKEEEEQEEEDVIDDYHDIQREEEQHEHEEQHVIDCATAPPEYAQWCSPGCGNIHLPICGPVYGQILPETMEDWPLELGRYDEKYWPYRSTTRFADRTRSDLHKVLCYKGDPKSYSFNPYVDEPVFYKPWPESYLDPEDVIRSNIPFPLKGDITRWKCVFDNTNSDIDPTIDCWSRRDGCDENDPEPGPPTHISFRMGNVLCDLGNDIRIPYPNFASGDGFLARGSINYREGDLGYTWLPPLLQYRYRIPGLNTGTLVSNWLPVDIRYSPSALKDSVTECEIYRIYAGARSRNRCEGFTEGPEISRSFEVNYVPRISKIEVAENPNGGVSGHLNRSGAEYDFACDIENPKTFTVVFKDDDGCGDLWESFPADTNICGGSKTSSLSLRAVNSATGTVFSGPVSPVPGSVRCEGSNLVVADFSLEFVGDENVNLDIQAKADDIVGDSSGWRTAFSWAYDGRVPELQIQSDIVVGVDKLNVDWSAKDDRVSLSGVRGLRVSSKLTEGSILQGDSYYGPISYNGQEYDLPFDEWVAVWNPGLLSAADAKLRKEVSSIDLVNIGMNQDGNLDFRLESVDRACNYAVADGSTIQLGSPWISTRGGFVHSGDDVQLAVKQALYSNILPEYPDAEEKTSLSTELLTVRGSNVLGFGDRDYVYDLLNYDKKLNHSWYEVLLNRARTRDPEGKMWSSGLINLDVCESKQHIYFVEGDLEVDPSDYEDLSPVNTLFGCVFIVKGNITIAEGDHKSKDVDPDDPDYTPEYDIVKGYFIADGEINIKFVDKDAEVRDGLKVVGGLFATGDSTSVRLGRSLQLRDNLQFPTLIVFHDSRYLDVARKVLGSTLGGGYIRDIGLKE